MAATDLLTIGEARAAINNTDAALDTEIGGYISAVSLRIDGLCGPVVVRTITDEVHDGGATMIWPRYHPIYAVTSITEHDAAVPTILTAETALVTATAGYIFDPYVGVIYRRSDGRSTRFASGRANVVVTYEAGRYADTATVDARFKTAAAIFLAHLWRYEQGQGSATFGGTTESLGIPSFGTPNAVKDLLADELRSPTVA